MISIGSSWFSSVRILSLVIGAIVCAGLLESILAPLDHHSAHMSVPSAIVFAVFALNLAMTDRVGIGRCFVCAITLLTGVVSCLALLEAPFSPHLDFVGGVINAVRLRELGFSGDVSVSLLLFGLMGAVALLCRAQLPLLSVTVALALMLRTKIAVLEIILKGGVLGADMAIWTILCAWCLELALVVLLRNERLFSCLFMPGRPGNVMRLMAGATVLVPVLAGAMFLRLVGGSSEDLTQIAVLCGLLGWVMLLIVLAFGHYLQSIIEQLEETGRRDPLTRLLNRHGLAQEMDRRRVPFRGVILCDLDRFKSINDRFGHEQGDRVLRAVADALTATLSQDDALLARWGGEEFLILLPEEHESTLCEVAERCRKAIAQMPAHVTRGLGGKAVSASFGCAALPPGEQGLERALHAADRSLYAAKVAGRNRVVVSTPQHIHGALVPEPLY